MADYGGEYGHPYPRVDQYGNPVGPVDQYGIPIPREPSEQPAYSSGAVATSYGASDVTGVAPADYGTGVAAGHVLGGVAYPHEGPPGDIVSPHGAAHTHEGGVHGGLAPGETTAYPHEGVLGGAVYPEGAAHTHTHQGGVHGGLAPGETTAYAYEGMVVSGMTTGDQIQPIREEHTTIGETLRRSGSSSSSSSSSEDDGQGGRRKKKRSLKEKIKEKLPGSHKHEEYKAGQTVPTAGTGMQAAGTHEKKGIMDKIKEKLPGHH
uniref:Uncharacterized protein n=1 Tax=Avena sativa TaxID=4498 RepID=A0ACD5VSA8_AVESA